MTPLASFRAQIDTFMQMHPESPLTQEQKFGFSGLAYYEEDPTFVIEGVLDYFPADEPHIEMETSTGQVAHYRRWARVQFEIDGQPAALTIYSDPWGESLFMPFKDATNGRETYGAGRYLDSHRPGLTMRGERLIIDFNFCYNPTCAYSPDYSCPLPPRENWLDVTIEAGEKNFK